MQSYPTVNWWRGNLRPHESKISLIARFSNLNGIKYVACEKFFDSILGAENSLNEAAITKLAGTLGEDLGILKTVLEETVNLGRRHDFCLQPLKRHGEIRYCELCALVGYHSYVHEYRWLALCPIHGTPLKTSSVPISAGTIQYRRCKALTNLMQTACPQWPNAGTQPIVLEDYDDFNWLCNWAERIAITASQFSKNKIWSNIDRLFPEDEGYGQKLGQLHALDPIPDSRKRLFSEVQLDWEAEIIHFPMEAKKELARVAELGISPLVTMFTRIATYSAQPYGFVEKVEVCRQQLSTTHQHSRCEWRRDSPRVNCSWYKVPPGDIYWRATCPYKVAVEELELAVGRRMEVLSRRHREQERQDLIAHSVELLKHKLIGFTVDANVSPDGSLVWHPQVWPCLEWIGTLWLNTVLDQIVQFEVQSVFESLIGWLDSIEEEGHPYSYKEFSPTIRLSEVDDGLVLVRWQRRKIAS
jgi:hypothetical protein